MTDEYYLSASSPLFTLGKPKKNPRKTQEKPKRKPRKTQKKAKKTAGEIQGNQLDFKSASVCCLPQFFRLFV